MNTWTISAQVAAPQVECVDIANNGDVTLTWTPPSDPNGEFIEYRVYSNSSGSYNFIGSITNINTTSYTEVGANANANSISYIVTSAYNNGSVQEAVQADTVSSIFLVISNPNNGTAILQWNAISSNPLPNANSYYYIYKEYPAGNWFLNDSIPVGTVFYRDTIDICDDWINYQIVLNSANCQSGSNIGGDQFQDMLPPDEPSINYVTVDTATGEVIINWDTTYAADTYGYILLQNINGSWVFIDTVYGKYNTTYTNLNSFANFQSENYGVAAFDSCFHGSPPSSNTSPMGIAHRSVHLSPSVNVCSKEISLSWNSYVNWESGVNRYELYVQKNGGVFSLLQSSIDTTYLHENLESLSDYCYVVKAVSNSGVESLSNKTCKNMYQPPLPSISYLQSASVTNENEVTIDLKTSLNGKVSAFNLYRSDEEFINYELIDSQPPGATIVSFLDYDVSTNDQSYYYKVVVEDSCGNEADSTNIAKTILLTVNANSSIMTNLLQWSVYKEWDGNVKEYNIYRSVNGEYNSTAIATVPASQKYYEDQITNFVGTASDGEFCYYIEAVEQTNSYGVSARSLSNEYCVTQDPLVYVPNAFVIGGVNPIWKPVINLVDYSKYSVKVFGRKGHLVFNSSDPYAGWDGTYKGSPAMIGVYVYQIELEDGGGNPFVVSGHVTLVR